MLSNSVTMATSSSPMHIFPLAKPQPVKGIFRYKKKKLGTSNVKECTFCNPSIHMSVGKFHAKNRLTLYLTCFQFPCFFINSADDYQLHIFCFSSKKA
jgi:hypothetical protein